MLNNEKIIIEIRLCEVQTTKLLEELELFIAELNQKEPHYGYYPARASVNNRIKAIRKDLLGLRKIMYKEV